MAAEDEVGKTIVGSFDTLEQARSAVESLTSSGFAPGDINLIGSAGVRHQGGQGIVEGGSTIGVDTAAGTMAVDSSPDETAAPSAAGTGAVTGGVIGGAAALAASLAGLAIPGIGPLIAAGPIAMLLAGAGVGAAAGGVLGALTHMGVDEREARVYEEAVRRGHALVAVSVDDDGAPRAASMLRELGAFDIESRVAEWRRSGWTDGEPNATPVDERAATGEPVGERPAGHGTAGTAIGTVVAEAAMAASEAPAPSTMTQGPDVDRRSNPYEALRSPRDEGLARTHAEHTATGSGANLGSTMSAGTAGNVGDIGAGSSIRNAMGAGNPVDLGSVRASEDSQLPEPAPMQGGGRVGPAGDTASTMSTSDTSMSADAMMNETRIDANRSAQPPIRQRESADEHAVASGEDRRRNERESGGNRGVTGGAPAAAGAGFAQERPVASERGGAGAGDDRDAGVRGGAPHSER